MVLRRRRTLGGRLPILLQARQHFPREQGEVVDRLLVREPAGLRHHQKIAHPAAVFAEIDDLVVDLVGRAAEQDAGLDQILHARMSTTRPSLARVRGGVCPLSRRALSSTERYPGGLRNGTWTMAPVRR